MHHLLALLIVSCCLAFGSQPGEAQAMMYTCARPDGSVVCTVNTDESDPSVVCNHECLDCNMTCSARAHLIREGGEVMTAPSQSMPGRPAQSTRPGTVETPEYCQQRFDSCMDSCRSNPTNQSNFNFEACASSCRDTRSGCGTVK